MNKRALKIKKSFIFILLAMCMVFYAFAGPTNTQAPAGQVVWVKGSVKDISAGNGSRILKRRDAVYQQDSIVTDSTSSGEIVFSDGGLMTVSPGSTVRVSEYKFTGGSSSGDKSVIDVAKGGFRAITGAISKADPGAYQVRTPVATIGVRGTDFTVYFKSCVNLKEKQDCGLATKITKGGIIIENGIGRVVLLEGSNQTFATVGSATTTPTSSSQAPGTLSNDVSIQSATFGGGDLGAPIPAGFGGAPTGAAGPAQQVGGFCIQ